MVGKLQMGDKVTFFDRRLIFRSREKWCNGIYLGIPHYNPDFRDYCFVSVVDDDGCCYQAELVNSQLVFKGWDRFKERSVK